MPATTGISPYYAIYGSEPRDAASWFATGVTAENPKDTNALVIQLAMILKRTKEAMFNAQQTMEEFQNRKQKEVSFEIGDKVWLNRHA